MRNPSNFKNSIGMEFVYVPPCVFMMGSPEHEEGRHSDEAQHLVSLTKGFHIQNKPVTQNQWMQIMDENPSYFKRYAQNISKHGCGKCFLE